MDAYLQIRINKDVKERFAKVAKDNSTDTSSLVRGWIMEYLEEMEAKGDMSKEETINNLYDAGYELKIALGGFSKAKKHAWELNNLASNDLNAFIEKAMTLHVQHDLTMPSELLTARSDSTLAQALVMGMLGEKRI